MTRKTRMTPAEFTRWTDLSAKVEAVCQDWEGPEMTSAEWDEYRTLRDERVLPPLTPAVGTPTTYGIGGDRYPGQVFMVERGGREIWTETKGLGLQRFTYRPSTGRYVEKGIGCGSLSIGVAVERYDPSF